jgi:hypothetical protein
MSRALKLPTLKCLRCGHTWFPRQAELPKTCANKECKSPYWDRPRRKTGKPKGRITVKKES